MSAINELFDKEVNGYRNQYGGYSDLISSRIIQGRRRAAFGKESLDIVDPIIDEIWGGYVSVPSPSPHSYFDYYFSGQDIRVYIDGLVDDPEFASLPIVQMGISIQQKKEPIYGFWDYTYSAVMRGTRIISGQMTVATKSPDYVKNLLAAAARARSQNVRGVDYQSYRQLTEDDQLIDQYWNKNLDPATTYQGHTVFSVHPPFTLVIMYGLQSVSLNPATYTSDQFEIWTKYAQDNALATDTNERLVDSDPAKQSNRMILEAVELVDCSTGYSSTGEVVTETYNFFARDVMTPSPNDKPVP